MSKVDFQQVWDEACVAYAAAYRGEQPPQFLVGDAVGLSNQIDYSKPVYVMDGLCGFAWVNVGDGRKPFARWMKQRDVGYKDYYGGYAVWSSEFMRGEGQSVDRKVAGCKAVAEVFKRYGIEASVRSRLD